MKLGAWLIPQFKLHGDRLSDDESEIIIMPNDLKVQQDINLKTRNNLDQQW